VDVYGWQGVRTALASARMPVRVILADDHPVVRRGLCQLLQDEGEFDVVAQAGSVEEAIRCVGTHRPDVLVLDLNMPGRSSLDAITELRTEHPGTQVVILTMQDEPAYARRALRDGALAYVLKDAADEELVTAVRAAAGGQRYVNPRLGARLATQEQSGPPGGLSEREVEVLRLVALGCTNSEIAERLFLSVRTVETHRAHIQQKLRLRMRSDLVRYAFEHDLLER
jgi:two-component system response regulator NreC